MRRFFPLACSTLTLIATLLTPSLRAAEPTKAQPRSSGADAAVSQSHNGQVATAPKIDLNTATLAELEELPGVGPATAKEIVAARPFRNVNQLTNVTGIGPAKFAVLRPHVTVRRASSVGRPAGVERATGSTSSGSISNGPETDSASPSHATKSKLAPGQKVNLNSATKGELEALPGIGPVKAQAIIDARPFNRPEDVMKVNGIKEGVFGEIKDHITVR